MQAGRFISLVKNVTDLRPEELNEAKELASHYPYSQLLHLIIARASRDQKGSDEQASLHRAAVYATDRTVLKAVMTRTITPRVEPVPEEKKKVQPPAKPVVADPVGKPVNPEPSKAETIKPAPVEAKTKPINVEPVKLAQAETKSPPAKAEPVKPTQLEANVQPAKVEPKPVAPITSQEITLEGDALRSDLKKELNRLHELMGNFDAAYEQMKKGEPVTPAKPAPVAKKPTATPKPEPQPEAKAPSPIHEAPLIEEIKTSKRKPKIVSPKVAEQGEIIDQFIKVVPTLPRTKPTEPTLDLSEESVNIGDGIVSETLVEILLKQGKKAKAIEMLKKLIWKFPQKKAYFAAQIEALKG